MLLINLIRLPPTGEPDTSNKNAGGVIELLILIANLGTRYDPPPIMEGRSPVE